MDQNYLCDFTKKLLSIDSPSGYTAHAIAFLEKEATDLGYETLEMKKEIFILLLKVKMNLEQLVSALIRIP